MTESIPTGNIVTVHDNTRFIYCILISMRHYKGYHHGFQSLWSFISSPPAQWEVPPISLILSGSEQQQQSNQRKDNTNQT